MDYENRDNQEDNVRYLESFNDEQILRKHITKYSATPEQSYGVACELLQDCLYNPKITEQAPQHKHLLAYIDDAITKLTYAINHDFSETNKDLRNEVDEARKIFCNLEVEQDSADNIDSDEWELNELRLHEANIILAQKREYHLYAGFLCNAVQDLTKKALGDEYDDRKSVLGNMIEAASIFDPVKHLDRETPAQTLQQMCLDNLELDIRIVNDFKIKDFKPENLDYAKN